MKIINKITGETLAESMTNHSMTLEEACDLAGIKLMETEEDVLNEDGYDCENLEMEW